MIHLANSADRDTWLRARMQGVGASEVAAVLGENPYQTRAELAAVKRGDAPRFEGNLITRLGSHLEPFVLDEWCKETGITAQLWGDLLQDAMQPYLLATPDAKAEIPDQHGLVLVEIKTTAGRWDKSGVPVYVQLQVQAQMAVTNGVQCHVVWLHLPTRKLHSQVFPRHDAVIRRIRREVGKFWKTEVARGNRANVSGSDAGGPGANVGRE